MQYFQPSPGLPRIAFHTYGDAKASHRVLFTMGLGGTAGQWEPQVEFFSKLPDFQICTYDNRGVGFSDAVPGRWTTRAMALDALALLDHLGWTKDVHVVGLSMGGMITQELVLTDIPRFSSMSLISTISGGPHSLQLFLLKAHTGIWKVVRTFTARDPKINLQSGLELLYPREFLEARSIDPKTGQEESNLRIYRKALVRRGAADRAAGMPPTPLSTILKQAAAVATHRTSSDRFATIDAMLQDATAIITGDQDILVNPRNSDILHQYLPGSRLVTLACAGHGVNESAAPRVNEELLANIHRGVARRHQPRSRL